MANAYNDSLATWLAQQHRDEISRSTADNICRSIASWLETNSSKYRWFGDNDPCECGDQQPEAAMDHLAGQIRAGESIQHHSSCGNNDDEDDDDDEEVEDQNTTINKTEPTGDEGAHMAKTLNQLLKDELGTDDDDKVEAVADVVLDWLQRCERNGNLGMAPAWRERVEMNRKHENSTGQGM